MKNINLQKLTAKYPINDELRSVIYQNSIQDYKIYYTALKINKRMQEELFSEK